MARVLLLLLISGATAALLVAIGCSQQQVASDAGSPCAPSGPLPMCALYLGPVDSAIDSADAGRVLQCTSQAPACTLVGSYWLCCDPCIGEERAFCLLQ
jgi:hypothetical protein